MEQMSLWITLNNSIVINSNSARVILFLEFTLACKYSTLVLWQRSSVNALSLIFTGFLVRTVSALPARSGLEHSRWQCVFGTRFTIWSASNVQPVRSTSVWVTDTCSLTQILCVNRTSLSGPNSTITRLFSRISIALPYPAGLKVDEPLL